jgi:hypothetical protein
MNDLALLQGLKPNTLAEQTETLLSSNKIKNIKLCSAATNEVKSGLINPNHWGVVDFEDKENVVDLGKNPIVACLGYRPTGWNTSDEDNIHVTHDVNSPEFKEIIAKASEPDSGCFFGPEFLIYIPEYNEFVTYLVSSFTHKKKATTLKMLSCVFEGEQPRKNLVEFGCTVIKKKHTYAVPEFKESDLELDLQKIDLKKMVEQINLFRDPPKFVKKEKAEETRER